MVDIVEAVDGGAFRRAGGRQNEFASPISVPRCFPSVKLPIGRPDADRAFRQSFSPEENRLAQAWLRRGGRIDTGGPRGRSECSVERGERQPHARREFQTGGVVHRQTVLIGKLEHRPPYAYRGYRLHLDWQGVEVGTDTASPPHSEQYAADLNRPER